jgi:hypothetical protein
MCLGAATCGRTGLSADDLAFEDDAGTCIASACTTAHADCGTLEGPCGTEVCGHCAVPSTCGGAGKANQCGCLPTTCTALGAACGQVLDGCDGILECGMCPPDAICGGGGGPNTCGPAACTAKSCVDQSIGCGKVSDGCSKILECGGCGAPDTCGGGGIINVCGCTRVTCAELGAACGTSSDGYGGTIDCGTCTPPDTCGGGGPGKCGCVPTTCSAEGAQCGFILDRCGGTLQCGTDCSEHSHHDEISVCVGIGPTACSEEGQSSVRKTRLKQAEAQFAGAEVKKGVDPERSASVESWLVCARGRVDARRAWRRCSARAIPRPRSRRRFGAVLFADKGIQVLNDDNLHREVLLTAVDVLRALAGAARGQGAR